MVARGHLKVPHKRTDLAYMRRHRSDKRVSFRELIAWLPRGHELSEDVWKARHRLMKWVAWLHVPGLLVVGLANGFGFAHAAGLMGWVVGPLILVHFVRRRSVRAMWISLALLSSSGLLVHFTDGLIESHFHFFVVISLIALYQDWRPFLIGLAFILGHHGLLGSLFPEDVYNHPAALANPLLWALIHAGYILGLVAVLVFQWKFAETAISALATSEERFRNAFDHAPIAICLARPDGRFLQVNPAMCDMFGYTQEQLLSLSWMDITHPDDIDKSRNVASELLNGPTESITVEKRYLRSDGEIVSAQVSLSVIRDIEGSPLYMVGQVVDLTDLKRSHRRLEELVRSKDQFLASVSHELRTPLTAVVGFAELLQQEQSNLSASERDEMIRVIAHQAFDLSSIVEDVLVAARAERGILEISTVPTDLRAQISQVLETYEPEAVAGVRVVGESRRAAGDPGRVRQILRNMISNALRYGGDDIQITLHTGEASVGVTVSDNGSGIPEQERALVFEPYHRAHDAPGMTGSMGLGLSVARKLARLMGGDLTYRYKNGRSIFELSLPPAGQNTTPPDTFEASLESAVNPS